jgi:hypothetical protein
MTEFHKQMLKFVEESQDIQKRTAQLQADTGIFNEKLGSFLKESGLPENFSIPEICLLAIRKAQG